MQQKLKQWVSKLLKVPEAKIETDHNLQKYGFDSLNAMRLIHRIEEHYGITLKPVHIYEHNSVEALAGFMQTQLKGILPDDKSGKDDSPDTASHSQHTASHTASLCTAMDVDKLPVGQVDHLLSQILNGRFDNVHCDECGTPLVSALTKKANQRIS
jgi:acyl carrier protein